MRSEFVTAITHEAVHDERIIFLTGDLGFKALEPLQQAVGQRFINAGVAEQNMASVAAGLASVGLRPWAYSIAPFMTLRPYEQIRNDIGLHNLDAKLVGNGGGYGYGIMGATHHLLEDFACLSCVPNMRIEVPCFASDVAEAVAVMAKSPGPQYLRLGLSAQLTLVEKLTPFAPWRVLKRSPHENGLLIIGIGPVMGQALVAAHESRLEDVEVWLVGELPLAPLPEAFIQAVARARAVICVEEHYAVGGLGSQLLIALAQVGIWPRLFVHRFAKGYPSGTYGGQPFHLRESGLDAVSLQHCLAELSR